MHNKSKKTKIEKHKSSRLIIGGHKNHGKDTVAELLEKKYGLRFLSSSEFACEHFIYDQLSPKYGYKNSQQCFNDRVNHREEWYLAIRDFNKHDRARLGKLIYKNAPVYCGIRDIEEFIELRKCNQFDISVWVDASKRKPLEDPASISVKQSSFDVTIDNNDSKADLEANIDRFIAFINS